MEKQASFELARALRKLIKSSLRGYVLIDGIVTAVNDNFTCDVTVQGVAFSDVAIVVLIGSQASIYPVPVLNTTCLVQFRDGNINFPQIHSFHRVQKLLINCTELVEFNGGTHGGLPVTPDLVTRLNNIENQQNQILGILKGINIPSTPYSFSPLFSSINNLTPTVPNDIQSKTITQ